MATYRTLREASALRDYVTPRTRKEAGMHGPLDDLDEDFGNGAGIVLWGIVGALALWVFLVLVLA